MLTQNLLIGVGAGIFGTFVMDFLNVMLSKTKIVAQGNPANLGMISAGWLKGRFVYSNIGEIAQIKNAAKKGFIAHYIIGSILGAIMALYISLKLPLSEMELFPVYYGISTTVFSLFFLYPSIGLGFFGLKGPKEGKFLQTSVINHINYGLGLYLYYMIISLL